MSANNYILIEKKNGKFAVNSVDVDTGGGYPVGEFDSFKDARDAAHKEARGENDGVPAEYGVEIDESCFEDKEPSQ